MDRTLKARIDADPRPTHRACLVAGCSCQAARSVPSRRPALIAALAGITGETAGRERSPDPAWRFVGLLVA